MKSRPRLLSLALSIAFLLPLSLTAQVPVAGFGPGDGHFSYDRTTYWEATYDMAIDSQGRIVLGFLFEDGAGEFWAAIYRLTEAGFGDPNFGILGLWVESTVACRGDLPVSVTVDASDRPLIGCTYTFDQGGDPTRPNSDWFIRRVTAGGVTDVNKVGAFDLDIVNDMMEDRLRQIEIMADGRLVAVGSAQWSGSDHDMAMIVWEPTGTDDFALDTDFSGDGRHTVAFDLGGSDFDQAERVVQDGAFFVLGGTAAVAGGDHMALARMSATTATPDTTFSGDGEADFAYQPFGGVASVGNALEDLLVHPSGGYVLAGSTDTTTTKGVLGRVNSVGALDPTWGSVGWSLLDLSYPDLLLSEADNEIFAFAMDAQGRFVGVGWVRDPTPTAAAYGFIARWTATGALDTSFGSTGVAFFDAQPPGQPAGAGFFGVELVDLGQAAVAAGFRTGVTGGINRADSDLLATKFHLEAIFIDGFESGNTLAWQ